MNKTTILVVEDDIAVRNLITTTLDTHDYRYIRAENGQNALQAISSKKPDIVLLDLGLPDIDGIDVIKRVRNWSEVPIIVISARCEDTDKIDALDSGADDYLTKPFSVEELLARLRVTQRRLASLKNSDPEDSEFRNGEMKIDYAAGSVFINSEEIHLTPIEYKLLCLLAKNSGKVLTHTFITNSIWGSSFDSDVASLRVFMATLRKKLDKSSKSGQQYIQTHVGVGYRMNKL
ncbi:MAG: response regulator transcription factor [Oscillospiraceae bacterium]|nr:response regulator transcription factor [Oscillospiraceae bacterium]